MSNFQIRQSGIIFGALINFVFFTTIIVLLKGWDKIFNDPVVLIFLTIMTVFCIAEGQEGSRRQEIIVWDVENQLDIFLTILTGLIFLLILVISLYEYLVVTLEINNVVRSFGAVIACIGIILRILAIRALRDAFVSLPRVTVGQALVINGPYGVLRHPSETGIICISIGIAWLVGSLAGLTVVGLLLIPLCIFRVTREENLLLKNFKQAYVDYKSHVPGLFPTLTGGI